MHYFNVCSKRSYSTKDGIKNQVDQVGNIRVTENGNWYLTLYLFPDMQFKVFPSQNQDLPKIEA